MSRPSHSAQRDRAFGLFYARKGAANAIVQGERGCGDKHQNKLRIADWYRKVGMLPREERDREVPMGANVVLLRRANTNTPERG